MGSPSDYASVPRDSFETEQLLAPPPVSQPAFSPSLAPALRTLTSTSLRSVLRLFAICITTAAASCITAGNVTNPWKDAATLLAVIFAWLTLGLEFVLLPMERYRRPQRTKEILCTRCTAKMVVRGNDPAMWWLDVGCWAFILTAGIISFANMKYRGLLAAGGALSLFPMISHALLALNWVPKANFALQISRNGAPGSLALQVGRNVATSHGPSGREQARKSEAGEASSGERHGLPYRDEDVLGA